jgi:hypothetical protein
MIEPDHPDLSIGQQCRLLSITRSSFYYEPKGESEQNLGLMRQIDEQFLETPFFGVRQMTWHLRNDGHLVNEKRIRRLMRLMGVRRGNGPPDRFLNPSHCRSIRSPTRAGRRRGIRPIPTCYEGCGWIARTRSGARTSPTCRCGVGSSTSWRSWTGTPARFCPGGSRTRWKPLFAAIDPPDRLLDAPTLHRGAERGHPQVRPARDHEHGSGQPIHVLRLDGSAASIWRAHIDGWEGPVPRQHIYREAVAHPEIRVRLPACLGDRIGDESGDPEMDDLLQPPAPAFSLGRPTSGAGLLAEK